LTSRVRCGSFVIAFTAILLVGGTKAKATPPDPRYFRYDQVVSLLANWEATYPDILHREVIGYTLVGHEPIWAARISDHASQREVEPALLFHAAQHANEANGTGAIMYQMRRLLEGYGQDPAITRMVDSLEVWFVPIVNVDGHRLAFSDGPDSARWRKTARDNNGDGFTIYPIDGVDPNRNWDWRWAEFDSTGYSSSDYKGPWPFSEPEVVALRDFILREAPVFVMDYHSPVTSSPPNIIWWPWRNTYQGIDGPDAPFFRPIGTELGRRTQTEIDTLYFNGASPTLYNLPKEQNWIYARTGICAFLMEISSHNWWEGAMVDTIAQRVGRGSFYLLERAKDGPGLTGTVRDADTGRPLIAEVRVLTAHNDSIGPHLTEARFGAFWRLLNAGFYTVVVTCPGYHSISEQVVLMRSGWVTRDYRLVVDPASALPDRNGPLVSDPGGARGCEPDPAVLAVLRLENPLRSGRDVHLTLSRPGEVSLDLLDVAGRRLLTVWSGALPAGTHSACVGRGLPAGAYWLRLQTAGQVTNRRVTIVR
jgi:hypothetical protein